MPKRWNQKIAFPTDSYLLKVVEEEVKSTKKGTPTVSLVLEVVSPETNEVAGEEIEVVGAKVYKSIYFKSVDDDGNINQTKTDNMTRMNEELYQKFGLTYNGNSDNPNTGFKNKYVWAVVTNATREQRKNPTQEQLNRGQQGDIILYPVSHPDPEKAGKPMVNNGTDIKEFTCLGEAPANSPLA